MKLSLLCLSPSANHHWMKIILVINLWFIWRNNKSDHFLSLPLSFSLTRSDWQIDRSMNIPPHGHISLRELINVKVIRLRVCKCTASRISLSHLNIVPLHEVWWNITHMSVFVALRTIFNCGAELITSRKKKQQQKQPLWTFHITLHSSVIVAN